MVDKDIDEQAIAELIRPISKELVIAMTDASNAVLETHRSAIDAAYPAHVGGLLRMAMCHSLPQFVNNCCRSISEERQLLIAATLVTEVLANATELEKERASHGPPQTIDDIIAAFNREVAEGQGDDNKTDDNNRGPA